MEAAIASKESAKMSEVAAVDNTTLFVRGLGPSTTSAALEAHFSGVGPIRHAFVVTDQDKATPKCKGFGFIQYTNAEDATDALAILQGSILAHRKVRLELAKRRQRNGGRDGTAVPETGVDEDGGLKTHVKKTRFQAETKNGNSTARSGPINPAGSTNVTPLVGSLAMRTVVVTASRSKPAGTILSESAVLRAIGSGDPESGFDSCVSTGNGTELRCVYRSWPLAGKAAARVHGVDYSACIDALRGGKRCRVIIRNLPFLVDVEELRQYFSKSGCIRELTFPSPSSIRHTPKAKNTGNVVDGDDSLSVTAGYAFVEYFLAAHANHAVSTLNGVKLGGRVLAVDIAVSKAVYEALGKGEAPDVDCPSSVADNRTTLASGEDISLTPRKLTEGVDDDDPHSGRTPDTRPSQKLDEIDPSCDMHVPRLKDATSSPDEMSRTVFVRNVLYETSALELRAAMEQFGIIEQAVIVVDRLTGRPRGTGFVRFKEECSATKAVHVGSGVDVANPMTQSSLVHASHTSGIVVGGRCLLVSRAVDRSKARDLVGESRVTEDTKSDPRNLRLAWIGRIKPGSPEASGLSEDDIRKRAHAEKEKRNKLAHNPNAFVSDVRLSVRNLPRDFDEKVLKHMCICASRVGGTANATVSRVAPRITHVKIVRDEVRKDRSRGYGFVQFQDHAHALLALNSMNNNPSAIEALIREKPKALMIDDERARLLRKQWGDSRRLIVEFSVEDMRQVRIIEQVKQKGREKSVAIAAERSKAAETQLNPTSGTRESSSKAPTGNQRKRARDARESICESKSKTRSGKFVRYQSDEHVDFVVGKTCQTGMPDLDPRVGKSLPKLCNPTGSSSGQRYRTNSDRPSVISEQDRPTKKSKRGRAMKLDKTEQKFEDLVDAYKLKLASKPSNLECGSADCGKIF
jgi:nucleolar protein 4